MDAESLPLSIDVQESECDKLNGVYLRVVDSSSREKPYYKKKGAKEPLYLYWLKGKWKLGLRLDYHKSFAVSKDGPGGLNPCDPSRAWKVYDHGTKEHKDSQSMRMVAVKLSPKAGPKASPKAGPKASPKVGPKTNASAPEEPKAKRPKVKNDDDATPALAPHVSSSTGSSTDESSSPPHEPKKAQEAPASSNDSAVAKGAAQDGPATSNASTVAMEEKFEAKLRASLSILGSPEEEQRRLDWFKKKLTSVKEYQGTMFAQETVQLIFNRVQDDFGTQKYSVKAYAATHPSLEGTPAPTVSRVAPAAASPPADDAGQPLTPEKTMSAQRLMQPVTPEKRP